MKKKFLVYILICAIAVSCVSCSCQHTYIETEVAATCTEEGYNLFTCSKCSDSYKGDKTTPKTNHKGVAECTVCGENIVSLWEEFVYQQDGSDHVNPKPIVIGETTLSISYGVADTYDCIMSSNKVKGSYVEALLLGYNAYDETWEWQYICSLGSIEISAGGSFEKWSSRSNSLPCSYSDFSFNILEDVKFLYNTLVNQVNAELVEDGYNFKLENLGLGQ